MSRRRLALALIGALVAGAGGYLVVAARQPPELATNSATSSARWAGAESDPALLAEALATERDHTVRGELLRRATRRPDALALLRSAWDATDDHTAREQLLVEAARLGAPGAASWLADVADSDDVLAVRAGASLGTIADRRAAPELAKLAAADRSVLVRANAARALGRAGAEEHAPMLAQLVTDAAQPLRVRQQAALSLGHLRVPPAGLVNALETARADRSTNGEQLRISLIQSLETLGTREAHDALRAYASAKPSPTEAAFLDRALARR